MEKILVLVIIALLQWSSGHLTPEDVYEKYQFAYSTGDSGRHIRQEQADDSGRVTGMFSYVDPNGILRTTRYVAAPGLGFRAFGDDIPEIGLVVNHPPNSASEHVSAEINHQVHDAQDHFVHEDISSESNRVGALSSLERNETVSAAAINATDVMPDATSDITTTENPHMLNASDVQSVSPIEATESLLVENTNHTAYEIPPGHLRENEILNSTIHATHSPVHSFIMPHFYHNTPFGFVPFVYALPNAFTYNHISPHYQLVL